MSTTKPNVPAMRPSRVLRKMRAGQLASCTKANIIEPHIVEIAARNGFDAIWLCLEHTPVSMAQIDECIRAAKQFDMDAVVRTKRGSYSDLIVPFEADAAAIMVPHCMSGADAKKIAWDTKFHPIGRRPLDSGNADGAYCSIPLLDYLKQANEERMVIVQIEDPEAMDELEAIAATPGIDMLLFGPGDFSHALGIPGQFTDPRVIKAREQVAKVARKHGKWAGTVSSTADIKRFADMGYTFLASGADVLALMEYFAKVQSAFTGVTYASAESVYKA